MQIWWEKYEVFLKKNRNNTTFPTTSLTATDLELSNFQTSITHLDLEISTSNPFSNLTYSHPSGSNCNHNHRLFISISQHKSEDVKLHCCHCEVLSQHRRQHSNNLPSHISQVFDHNQQRQGKYNSSSNNDVIRVPNNTTMWCTQYQTTAAHLTAQCDQYKVYNKQH